MPVSGDTLERLVRAAPVPTQPEPRVVGIDERASRRGHSYGTMVVDLERHTVLDLLPRPRPLLLSTPSAAWFFRTSCGAERQVRSR